MRCPQIRITPEDRQKYLRDSQIVTLEVLFTILSVTNVLVLYYLMSVVIPFPITVTWFQFLIGLIYARVLGECGKEFPNLAYFVPLKIFWNQILDLLFPTAAFIGMVTFGNLLLARIPSVAVFPVAASFAIASHHVTRFIGCGQIYRPIRWAAIGLIFIGFLISCLDTFSTGGHAISLALAYGIAAAAYRGCFLERAMHTVRGLGNNLHNQQIVVGIIVLPIVIAFTRERRFLTYMPTDFSRIFTWLMWGCLATAAMLPFVKNIVANRLIKLGGQPPWRFLEIFSMLTIFIIGWLLFDRLSITGFFAFVFVLGGRTLNSMDALSVEGMPQRPPAFNRVGPRLKESNIPQNVGAHGASQPFLSHEDDGTVSVNSTTGKLREETLDPHYLQYNRDPAAPDGHAQMDLPSGSGLGRADIEGVANLSRAANIEPTTKELTSNTAPQASGHNLIKHPSELTVGLGDASPTGVAGLSAAALESADDSKSRSGMDSTTRTGGMGGTYDDNEPEIPSGGITHSLSPQLGIRIHGNTSLDAQSSHSGAMGDKTESPEIPSGGITHSLSPKLGIKI